MRIEVRVISDEYPPFSWEAGKYPLTLEIDHPEKLSRWLIFIKWLLVIPNIIVLMVLITETEFDPRLLT